jgi:hypothetical protein
MKVAFYQSSGEWTGSSRAFAAVADAFAEAGDSVRFIVPLDSRVQERVSGRNYDVQTFDPRDWWITRIARLRRLLREHGAEVVFVHTASEHLDAAVVARTGVRCAVVRRTPSGARLVLGWRTGIGARLAPSAFLFASDMEARRALVSKKLGPVVAAALGVSVRAAEEKAEPAEVEEDSTDAYHIICIYDGLSRGRTALPIRTVAQLAPRHPQIRLTLVGPGSDAEEIRMHVAALDILPRVDLLGERDDLPQLMRDATYGWIACTGDDAAFAMLDLMAAGLPVVVQNDGTARQYVLDGITGMLVHAEDANLAAGILATVLGRTEQVAGMAEAARARVAREFAQSRMLEGFDQAARAARRQPAG